MNLEKIKKNYSTLPQMDFHLCFDRLLSGSASAFISGFKWAAQYRGQTTGLFGCCQLVGYLLD
jgi:hypothetical protein